MQIKNILALLAGMAITSAIANPIPEADPNSEAGIEAVEPVKRDGDDLGKFEEEFNDFWDRRRDASPEADVEVQDIHELDRRAEQVAQDAQWVNPGWNRGWNRAGRWGNNNAWRGNNWRGNVWRGNNWRGNAWRGNNWRGNGRW